jgi:hypothetical protein
MKPANTDSLPVRLVIYFVGATLLIALLISAMLIQQGKPPGDMNTIVLSCVTGLLALLGRTTTAEAAKPVEVITPPNEPLEVVEAAPVEVVDEAPQDDGQTEVKPTKRKATR